jgi:hypothetical protein
MTIRWAAVFTPRCLCVGMLVGGCIRGCMQHMAVCAWSRCLMTTRPAAAWVRVL